MVIINIADLIWRHSRYYHEPKNFKRLLRHLSTLVVSSAHRFVGSQILSNTESAFTNLKHALKLCAKFRGTFYFTSTNLKHALKLCAKF